MLSNITFNCDIEHTDVAVIIAMHHIVQHIRGGGKYYLTVFV